MRARLVPWVVLLTACSADPPEPAAPGGELADGTRVVVGDDGAFSLEAGGRTLLATAPGAAVTVRRYEERVDSLFGMWSFAREGEESEALSSVERQATDASGVTLELAGPTARASVRVSVLRPGEATRVTISVEGYAGARSIAVPVACDAEASFYGFGEQYSGTDQRGEAFALMVSEQGIGRDGRPNMIGTRGDRHTTYFPMPYFLDARGHGVLFQTPYRTLVDLCATDPDVAWIEVESAEPVDLVVFHGPAPKDVIRQLGDQVGRPKLPPPWAFRPWIGAQGGRDAVLARVATLEASGIDASAIWSQDWTGKRTNFGGGSGVQYRWVADDVLYPDLPGMIGELRSRGYRFLGYANPFVMPNLDHFVEMDAGDMLIQKGGETYLHASPAGDASHPDPTRPAARDYTRAALSRMVSDLGMDGWMADFAEWVPLDAEYADGSDPRAMHNLYPTEWHRLSREVMDELRPDGDWVVFTRSGWTNEQRVAQIVWAGDQECTWAPEDGLPTVVPALLNLGISGLPFVTHDIAGFSGGPSTKELYQRWAELGAFTPIMRTHDGNMKDQNWSWDKDAETLAHFRRMTELHAVLIPEFLALAEEAANSGAPILRHLMLEFPDDAEARRVSDQFLIGDALLVAPVLTEGATTRSVYLPRGTWYDVWSGEAHEGGIRLTAPSPLGRPPVYSRGSDRGDLRAVP